MAQDIPDQVLLLMAEKFRMLSETTRLMILRTLMTEGELNVSSFSMQVWSLVGSRDERALSVG